jgi:hypothetical protein
LGSAGDDDFEEFDIVLTVIYYRSREFIFFVSSISMRIETMFVGISVAPGSAPPGFGFLCHPYLIAK